jgi:hypothetical protein
MAFLCEVVRSTASLKRDAAMGARNLAGLLLRFMFARK